MTVDGSGVAVGLGGNVAVGTAVGRAVGVGSGSQETRARVAMAASATAKYRTRRMLFPPLLCAHRYLCYVLTLFTNAKVTASGAVGTREAAPMDTPKAVLLRLLHERILYGQLLYLLTVLQVFRVETGAARLK